MRGSRVRQPSKCCPRCQSSRIHRSHRRASLERLLHALGAEIRRCHECRFRHASFATFSLPLSEPENTARRRTEFLVMASGFLVCLLFVWWIIRRFTELSG
jgi:hypothetical protein